MSYKDHSLSIDERIEDLLARMTLQEKVGQLNQKMYGWEAYEKTAAGIELTAAFKKEVEFGAGMGLLYGLFRSDPWSKVTFENGIPPGESAKVANRIQRYIIENTRLGIPVLLSEECPHGHQALGGTMIPTNIGVGSTWNPRLMEEVYQHIGKEVRSKGAHLGLVSTLDVLRDPRWGRSEECFSEDPYLVAQMTKAAVTGLQGDEKEGIIAVLKHFAAQGSGEGGKNAAAANIGERELREIHLPGMKAGVEVGALGCMAAYNEIDGIPCHANERLLTGILREEWGYEGIVMADGVAIDRLVMQTGSYEAAGALALSAGVDVSLWDTSFTTLESAVNNGKAKVEWIDRAVRRVLHLKFKLGLFENPYVEEVVSFEVINNPSFQEKNLQVARESVVLLKNEDELLPLQKNTKVAVIGPNADYLYNQLGDYTSVRQKDRGVTVLQGIQKHAQADVFYAKGCGVRDESTAGFQEAIEAAEQADVAILVLGGSSARDFDIQFDTNGAAIVTTDIAEMDCGEGVDLANLRLGGVQEALVQEIEKTGKPIITVLIQGRPHAVTRIVEQSDALLCGWYPGEEGGQAIGEILFGKVNPSAKLPVSIPRSSGQLPIYYNYKDYGAQLYRDMEANPLFSFGYGLSYTTFNYGNIKLSQPKISLRELNEGRRVVVSVDLVNDGGFDGAEVIQVYIRGLESSVTRRVKELKGFEKINLQRGEGKKVTFYLDKEALSVWNRDMEFVVEPGNVEVYLGGGMVGVQSITLNIIE